MYEQQQQRQQHRSLVKTASVLCIKIHSQPSSCSSRWSYSPRSRRTTFAHQTGWHAPFAALTFFQPLSTFIHWGLNESKTNRKQDDDLTSMVSHSAMGERQWWDQCLVSGHWWTHCSLLVSSFDGVQFLPGRRREEMRIFWKPVCSHRRS